MDFKKHLLSYLSEKEIELLISSFSEKSKHAALLNLRKIDDQTFLKLFPDVIKHPIVPHAYIYDKEKYQLGKTIFYELGCFYLQEPAAMCVSHLLSPKENELVLDMCAAPGGKTIQCSFLMNNTGLIVSNDISYSRQQATLENIEKLGIGNVLLTVSDISKNADFYRDTFDKIILDAPCSGSGMFRKEEKMLKDWTYEKVIKCQNMQKALIDSAIEMLKPGGTLIYSTCSYSYEENEEIIKYALKNPDISLEEINDNDLFYKSNDNIGVHLFPFIFPGEGHYICLLKKARTIKENKVTTNYKEFKFNNETFLTSLDFKVKNMQIVRYGVKKTEVIEKTERLDLHYARFLKDFDKEIELDDSQIKDYLIGLSINTNKELKKDTYLIKYQGIPINFEKIDNGIIKNHYPKKYRKKF